ncbi:CLUMA_CG019137, isoform A [Clunio marinus]|uniref:CLUMA_CG019137, isoform A n=1 Tax=Clunio marinus TaxID=568069 RepID=A0A1J1J057_9DIPT|nr:CLUMA_CG019137, isoform A [Clunio marinus]
MRNQVKHLIELSITTMLFDVMWKQSKSIELQNASGEWMNSEATRTPPRRGSITQGFIPTSDIIRKSISRSWTISNPEDDQPNAKNGIDPRLHVQSLGSSIHHQETNSYPNLIRINKSPYNSNMDFINSESYERISSPSQRRVLRQSTLPNPDLSYPNSNLKLPVSPKQQLSPQYSPYHTDNENEPESELPAPTQPMRYKIRRQSTLPCKPNDSSKYLSTSPNRTYSRSPDPSAIEGEHSSRFPPFVRQSTFPSNNGGDQFHSRQLPTSPNRLNYSKSPDSSGENGHVSPRRFMRQTTLPNPDQHIKLLPTSPPKKSPQFMKRSPEFQRQNTISNPEGMNTLSVHQHAPKFLPISPRQKQSFLFPLPSNAPRTFLSQQHFPTMNEDQPPPTNHVIREHSKMIKVRSHSNEEYSFNKSHVPPQPTEGRRLLPEIPNRARSPSRLVRQDHVKDEGGEKRSPIMKTFAEAKQTLNEDYEAQNQVYETQYTNEYSELNSTFAEADENNYNDQQEYASYENVQLNVQVDMTGTNNMIQYVAEQTVQFHEGEPRRYEFDSPRNKIPHALQSAESYINDSPSEYYTPDEYIKQAQKNRNRRRKSRELPADPEVIALSSTDDESRKHKPEAMRSVSEDSSPKTIKILPRRSFSQPEKETQKKIEPIKIPSPKELIQKSLEKPKTDMVEKAAPKKPVYKFPKMLEMRGDSKSFDTVVRQLIKNDNKDGDDKSQSMDDNLFSEKKEHKTTLNEAEIQNAVEQAAGLFKKVVLQRRKERKPADEENWNYLDTNSC